MITIKCSNSTIGTKSSGILNRHVEQRIDNSLLKQQSLVTQVPRASLLKYEVRKVIKLEKTQNISEQNISEQNISEQKQFSNLTTREISKDATKFCNFCKELNQKIIKLEKKMNIHENTYESEIKKLARELKETKDHYEKVLHENAALKAASSKILENLHDTKKCEKNIKQLENDINEEKMKTQRLSIKLEDANYEIGRLRTELINAQLENEKIVEENEDLAVDNEDLIKDRDEIIKIYDELFRESERLKHEVNIWKNVFQNNDDFNNINEVISPEPKDSKDGEVSSEDESVEEEIEEDKRLLLPPRNDITVKFVDPSKLFHTVEEIARGKFGKVYKVIEISSSIIYAAKYIKVTSKLRQDVLSTIEIMKRLHHVRLMSIFDVYDLGSQIVLILEYVGGRMLFERIVAKNSLTESDCVSYMKQILQGVHHMHANQVCHLDLKPENIVCAGHDTMDIKIIDFGLAKELHDKKDVKITAGSPEFVAPEILSFDPVSFASDMWSIGVLTYVLLSGLSPFMGEDDNDTLMNVSCGEFEYDTIAFQDISNEAKHFIDMLLISQPKKRGTISSCLTHNWMKPDKSKQKKIDLKNMREYLDKRKDKKTLSAVRAIRRFSSFGVGHSQVQNTNNPRVNSISLPKNLSGSSRHLLVQSSMQPTITEGEEGSDEDYDTVDSKNALSFGRKRYSSDTFNKLERCGVFIEMPESCGPIVEITEDTDTPDGLRKYLQRMINQGHLPGSEGPFTSELYCE